MSDQLFEPLSVSLRLLKVQSPHSLSYTTSVCHAVLKRVFPTHNRQTFPGKGMLTFSTIHHQHISSNTTYPCAALTQCSFWHNKCWLAKWTNWGDDLTFTGAWLPFGPFGVTEARSWQKISWHIIPDNINNGHGIIDLEHNVIKVSDQWLK